MSRTKLFAGAAALAVLMVSCETPTTMQQQRAFQAPTVTRNVVTTTDANGCTALSFVAPGTGALGTVAGNPDITFTGWSDEGLGAQLTASPGTVAFSAPADSVKLLYASPTSSTVTWDLADGSTQSSTLASSYTGATVTGPAGVNLDGFEITGQVNTFFLGSLTVCPAPVPTVLEVPIDIKPFSTKNPVNLKEHGKLPVAILSTADFDATTVDPSTVTLGNDDGNDTPVAQEGGRHHSHYMAETKDVNRDGLPDLLVHFDVRALVSNGDLDASTTELFLNGATTDGTAIHGSDSVTVLHHPDKGKHGHEGQHGNGHDQDGNQGHHK